MKQANDELNASKPLTAVKSSIGEKHLHASEKGKGPIELGDKGGEDTDQKGSRRQRQSRSRVEKRTKERSE